MGCRSFDGDHAVRDKMQTVGNEAGVERNTIVPHVDDPIMAVARVGGVMETGGRPAVFREIMNLQEERCAVTLQAGEDIEKKMVFGQEGIVNMNKVAGAAEMVVNPIDNLPGNAICGGP